MMPRSRLAFVATLTFLLSVLTISASTERRSLKEPILNQATSVDNTTFISANRILMFVTNHGSVGRDLAGYFGNDYGTYYPFLSEDQINQGGSIGPVMYDAGIWIGGIDATTGDTLVTVSEYASEYVPGPMSGGTFLPDDPSYRVYKLYADSLESNPNQDYLDWPADQGAPVNYGGKPAMRGDQMLWAVYNDADQENHDNFIYETEPIGVEVHQTVWAYDGVTGETPLDPEVTHTGTGLGNVAVHIDDPRFLTGHEYQVLFESDPVQGLMWKVYDVSIDQMVLPLEAVSYDESNIRAVDGMSIQLGEIGSYGVGCGNPDTDPDSPETWGWEVVGGGQRFTWESSNGYDFEGFHGALYWGGPGDTHGYGEHDPVPAESLVEVLLKLAETDSTGSFDPEDENVSYAYRYVRQSTYPPARPEFEPYIVDPDPPGGSYGFQDFAKSCPLSAWNVSVFPPVRLTLGYLENNAEFGALDGEYWPLTVDSLTAMGTNNTSTSGPREWLWIFLDEYSETPKAEYMLNAIDDPMPIMYWATWSRPDSSKVFHTGDQMRIIPGQCTNFSDDDVFSFEAPNAMAYEPESDKASIYFKYEMYNKGSHELHDAYLSFWVDPDLGLNGDDLVGCDTLTNSFFCYNSDNDDADFPSGVPAVGFRLIEGPIVPAPGESAVVDGVEMDNYRNLPMSAFAEFINGTDPDNVQESYCYMKGLRAKEPGYPPYMYDGEATTYMFSGDPINGTGDLDYAPDDRRMMASFGPFDFEPGEMKHLILKMSVGQGFDRLGSLSLLLNNLAYSPIITDVEDESDNALPHTFTLAQNYPNPFNPSTVIEYNLPERCKVRVDIFNVLGQKVVRLFHGEQAAGKQRVEWDGLDASGHTVATGVYFYRVTAGEAVATRKMMLLK